jgi:hypothetical protein
LFCDGNISASLVTAHASHPGAHGGRYCRFRASSYLRVPCFDRAEAGSAARNALIACTATPAWDARPACERHENFAERARRPEVDLAYRETNSETEMRMIVLLVSLFALAAPAHAAQQTHPKHESQSLEQKCRAMVGKETVEGEGRSHMGQMQAQRLSDCMMGMPN